MTAVIIPFDRSALTPEDQELMTDVAARLARFGLVVDRNTGRGFDGYRIRPSHSPLPRWVVIRFRTGQYQLKDGFMGVLAKGRTLESVVFPGWRQLRQEASGGSMDSVPQATTAEDRRRRLTSAVAQAVPAARSSGKERWAR